MESGWLQSDVHAMLLPMSDQREFDFWYAIHNTRVVLYPSRRLETFGATILNYHMISELMDTTAKVRVREGRIQAFRPQIVTPESFSSALLEGFGEEAQRYLDWLKEHHAEWRILQYGFTIRKEEIREHVISEQIDNVVAQVEKTVRSREDPLAAVVVGVEKPWEVCLLKLMADVSSHSFPGNVREMERHRLFTGSRNGAEDVRREIEQDFAAAGKDPGRVKALGRKLQRLGLFSEYEDRFFELVKSSQSG